MGKRAQGEKDPDWNPRFMVFNHAIHVYRRTQKMVSLLEFCFTGDFAGQSILTIVCSSISALQAPEQKVSGYNIDHQPQCALQYQLNYDADYKDAQNISGRDKWIEDKFDVDVSQACLQFRTISAAS